LSASRNPRRAAGFSGLAAVERILFDATGDFAGAPPTSHIDAASATGILNRLSKIGFVSMNKSLTF
jgi:hypothetical protein